MVQGYQPKLTLSFCQILALLLTKHAAHSFSMYKGSHSNRVQEQTFSRIILSTTNNEPLSYNDFGEENNGEENGEEEVNEDDEDDEDEDEGEDDAYTQLAPSEFKEDEVETSNGLSLGETLIDWGSEYDKLRDRQEDVNSGKVGPAKTLFRMMQSDNPNVVSAYTKERLLLFFLLTSLPIMIITIDVSIIPYAMFPPKCLGYRKFCEECQSRGKMIGKRIYINNYCFKIILQIIKVTFIFVVRW